MTCAVDFKQVFQHLFSDDVNLVEAYIFIAVVPVSRYILTIGPSNDKSDDMGWCGLISISDS